MPFGNRVGTLGDLVVYKITMSQWNLQNTSQDECLYWVGNLLFYHDQKVGDVRDGGNVDLDRDKLELIRKTWNQKFPSYEEERSAETPPPSDQEACHEAPIDEETAYDTELVDATLRQAGWSVQDLLKSCALPADEYLKEVKGA